MSLLLLAACGDRLSATAVCGEIPRPGTTGVATQTLVLTSDLSGFPDRDLFVLWLCDFAELCYPLLSYNEPRGVVAQWRGPNVIEVITDARSPQRWPPPAPRNPAWPQLHLQQVDTDLPYSGPVATQLAPTSGPLLTNSEVVCRRIRTFIG